MLRASEMDVADLVAACLTGNTVDPADTRAFVRGVYAAVTEMARAAAVAAPVAEETPAAPVPPVPVEETVTAEYIISLEDGRRYRALKRHLTARGLTPAQYCAKWGLPANYPMVAPAYSAQRSALAKRTGLGRIAA